MITIINENEKTKEKKRLKQVLVPRSVCLLLQLRSLPLWDVSKYGWRNGAKFTKFICIHIQCSYWHSRIYLFTFNNRIYILEIYLFTFICVFLIHDYICSHLRDVFIHIQRVISIHIQDRNIHSTFSAHHLCASVSIKHGLRTTDYGLD